ncbi:MAG: hypothetical protein ACK5KP_01470 [Paludibacteraceae bacterium]
MIRKITITTLLLIFSYFTYSQAVSLPFYLDKNKRIIVQYSIKGDIVKLLLDTGWEGNMLDVNLADKLDILPHKQGIKVQKFVSSGEPYTEIFPDNGMAHYIDTLFTYPWTLTNMHETAKSLDIDADVDGIVGINFIGYKYITEFDFKNQRLNFWDSLPSNYFDNENYKKIEIVRLDYGQPDTLKNVAAMYPYVRGEMTILGNVKLNPFFFIDSGSPYFFALQVHDEAVLKKLIDYKMEVVKKFGNNYPTYCFKIPELGIDTLYTNCSTSRVMPDVFNLYKKNLFRVLLGMDFLLRYEKVIIDAKRREGYFFEAK